MRRAKNPHTRENTLPSKQLPPLARLGNAAPREGYDYDLERCLGDHAQEEDAWLDLYGSHDNGNCAPTMQGKH